MTLEEMKEIAGRVAKALESLGSFSNVEVLTEEIVPGDPIPVAAIDNETGAEIVVSVNLL